MILTLHIRRQPIGATQKANSAKMHLWVALADQAEKFKQINEGTICFNDSSSSSSTDARYRITTSRYCSPVCFSINVRSREKISGSLCCSSDLQGGHVHQIQNRARQIVGQKAVGIFPITANLPEQLVVRVDHLAVIFLVGHGEILSGLVDRVKGYVFPVDIACDFPGRPLLYWPVLFPVTFSISRKNFSLPTGVPE